MIKCDNDNGYDDDEHDKSDEDKAKINKVDNNNDNISCY